VPGVEIPGASPTVEEPVLEIIDPTVPDDIEAEA
jgi:hypothetical protein